MHYSGKKNKVTICFQGILTRTLRSVRTETLLPTSIFSKKSIFNAALCRFKYSDWARAEHPNITCGSVSAALPHILRVTSLWVVPVFTPHTTGLCVRCTVWNLKLIVLKYFSPPFTLFEPCGAVFNMNSKVHLRKNSGKDFQPLCLGYSSLLFLCSSVCCCRRCFRCAKWCSLCSAISCWPFSFVVHPEFQVGVLASEEFRWKILLGEELQPLVVLLLCVICMGNCSRFTVRKHCFTHE